MQLRLEHLTVTFTAPSGERLPVLGPVSFEVASGTFVALLGPSGCGKSTLVRVLAGLQAPSGGASLLDHHIIRAPSPQVGMMFQEPTLMAWRTVTDNIALPLELAGVPRQKRHHAVHQLLPTLGLSEFANSYPSELSGGMAQRVALGRVLIQQPKVLLLDEPFGALDAITREQIRLDLLRIWSHQRQTAMMVTHDLHEAIFMADRVLVMSQRPGRIIADLDIALPRPRTIETTYTEAFLTLTRQVRAAIERT